MKEISPLAVVSPGAQIGAGTIIEPFAVIHDNVIIGEGSWIGSHAILYGGASLGKKCNIFPGAVISSIPQDKKFAGEDSVVILGDEVTVREYSTITRGTRFGGETTVGDGTLVMVRSHVAHDSKIGRHVVISAGVNMAGHVKIDDYAIIGGMVGIHQYSRIGAHAIVQACTYIMQDVPPFVKAGRNPLNYAGVNSVGLRRRGFTWEKIHEIQEIYRKFFLSNLNTTQALEAVETQIPATPERDEILDFIRNSERGIIKSYRGLLSKTKD